MKPALISGRRSSRAVVAGRTGRRGEKARIVAESLEPGANISEAARRNGVSRGLLTVWRRLAREAQGAFDGRPLFAPVRVTRDEDGRQREASACEDRPTRAASGAIEVAIADATIFVPMGADGATLETLILALRRAR